LAGIISSAITLLTTDAAPQPVKDLAENMPIVIEAIAENIPLVTLALVEAFASPKFQVEIAAAFVRGFVRGIKEAIPESVRIIKGELAKAMDFRPQIAEMWVAFRDGFNFELDEFKKGFAIRWVDVIQTISETFTSFFQGFISIFGVESVKQIGIALKTAMTSFRDVFKVGLEELWLSFKEGFQRAIVTALQGFVFEFSKLSKNFETAMTGAVNDFVNVFKREWADIRDGILQPFRTIAETLEELANKFNIDTGSGPKKEGGLIEGTGTPLDYLATGGTIPPGFPNDTFTAGLTSGEMVVPKGDTERLSSFLDRQDRVEGILTAIFQAVSAPISVKTTAEVDGRGLADIMLELSRRNARTA
jgi:hypothetical protein